MGTLILVLESAAGLVSAWLVLRVFQWGGRGCTESLLAWGILFITLVAGEGMLLGSTGYLGRSGFAAIQLLVLGFLLLLRRGQLVADRDRVSDLIRAGFAGLKANRWTGILALGLGLFLAVTFFLAALAEPVVYDALTYRLSRIGHWLQEGRVDFIVTNDPRQNYMPIVPDLVMSWLVSAFSWGYRTAALAQWAGGVLLLIVTVGFARLVDLSLAASLAAAWLVVGMANVAPQFTTVHTDLFTAGILVAAYYLWQKAALRRESSWVAGIGAGLALGAKGTVLYLGPTLLLWVAWIGWRSRLPLIGWVRTVLAMVLAVMIFAVPGFVRNWRTYGGVFGPVEFVSMHHQGAHGQLLEKTGLNLATSFVQVLEPNSQPPGLQTVTRAIDGWLADRLPVQDQFSYENLNRRETLENIINRREPDADATTFGILALAFFFLGVLLAVQSSRPGAGDIRWWSAGVLVFFIFFHAMQQWHPYGFRYFVLVAPWMAVVSAWGLAGVSARLGRVAWALALIAAAATAWQVLTHTHQAGWRAVVQPERARNYFIYRGWREWMRELDSPTDVVRLALPFNRPLAAFYRLAPARKIIPQTEAALVGLTAERAVDEFGEGWLIVPALRFMGNEGRVRARLWLFDGDPTSPFSLAAYHALAASGVEEPYVYRHKTFSDPNAFRHELLVRVGASGRATVHCEAAASVGWYYTVRSPLEVQRGEWQGGSHDIFLSLPTDKVAEVTVSFTVVMKGMDDLSSPTVKIEP